MALFDRYGSFFVMVSFDRNWNLLNIVLVIYSLTITKKHHHFHHHICQSENRICVVQKGGKTHHFLRCNLEIENFLFIVLAFGEFPVQILTILHTPSPNAQ